MRQLFLFLAAALLLVLMFNPAVQSDASNVSAFYYGIFEDGNMRSNDADYVVMLDDLAARGIRDILFTNKTPNVTMSDQRDFRVVAAPMGELYSAWFYNIAAPATLDAARAAINPIIDKLVGHPSVRGYNLFDDAVPAMNEKLKLAVQVFRERDLVNPASPMIVQRQLGLEVYSYVRPDIFLTYNYPALNQNAPCDFYLHSQHWVDEIRLTTQLKPADQPLWVVLQTHSTRDSPHDPDLTKLREPTVEEVRLQHWLAVGEGAKGIFWFIYSTLPGQNWRGLQDNPTLFNEITALASRVDVVKSTLKNTHKVTDRFHSPQPLDDVYVSTLYDASEQTYYVVVANQQCSQQSVSVESWYFDGGLRDMETNQSVALGEHFTLAGGDGRLFKVTGLTPGTYPLEQPNLVRNPSFEIDLDNNSLADEWSVTNQYLDKSHGWNSTTSVRITGPNGYFFQDIDLKPNTHYYLSHRVRAQNFSGGVLGMRYVKVNGPSQILASTTWHYSGSHDWEKRIVSFRTPPDMLDGRLDVIWAGMETGGVGWIDAIVLCEVRHPCEDRYLLEVSPPLSTTPTDTPVVTPGGNTPTVNPEVNLIINGGFEMFTASADQPEAWKMKGNGKARRKCKSAVPLFAFQGSCVYQIKGRVGTKSVLVQPLPFDLTSGTVLTLNLAVESKSLEAGLDVRVIARYATGKHKLVLDIPPGTYAYQVLTAHKILDADTVRLKIKIRSTSTAGRARLDAVSLFAR